MVVSPNTGDQWQMLSQFLRARAGVQPSADLRMIGWIQDKKLCIVVGFNGFIGSVCQIHTAFAPGFHFAPRAMLRAVFEFAFKDAKCKKLLGVVNSNNAKAMKFDTHLGFTEEHRLPGMHDDGGDLVILSMTPEQCRYLQADETVPMKVEVNHGR
jgi:RimJ/RimL family protein N-acetyltransferase